jgi:hypothetical protein
MGKQQTVLRSVQQAADTRASVPAGNPPEAKTTNDPGRDRATSHDNKGSSPAAASERYLAAAYRHYHGNPRQAPEEAKAHQGRHALIRRTWGQGKEMTRDERRLMNRYEAILKTYEDADLEAYRAARAGKPNNLKGPGQ